ncbi:MAG: cobalamin-binding protein [Deltaproteobacteria bacterium]|nr:cobalamin-binding protein [Deltaproteobacteria bacterium]
MKRFLSKYILALFVLFSAISVLPTGLSVASEGRAQAHKVVDQTGREIFVPKHPVRVVSLSPSMTEIIFDLGCENRLVGVTRFSNYPEKAKSVPRVGTYIYLDTERIVSLAPDLCIAIKDGNPKAVVDRLSGLGIPVYAVDPRDIKTVMQTVIETGILLGVEKRAQKLVRSMRERLSRISVRLPSSVERPKVFLQIGISPIVSAGKGTFVDELIRLAGGDNAAGMFSGYPRFSVEDVLSLGPDIIIVSSMARDRSFVEAIKKWRSWPGLPAAKSGRIFPADSDLLNRPTPRLVDGLEELAALIHPEIFGHDPAKARGD